MGEKEMEIGSIYEIDPDAARVPEAGSPGDLRLAEVEKYQKKYSRYTASGREAIVLALRGIKEQRPTLPKRCLLPAYMCDTVFAPFKRMGWEISFYHIDKELAADEMKLKDQIKRIRPGLLFVHAYYGVDTWKRMRSLFPEWKAQGICIMEDVTQSYYLKEAGQEADYVVGSLRKWYPIPDGGFVSSDERLPDGELESGESYGKERLEPLTRKWDYLHLLRTKEEKAQIKEDYLRQNRRMEEELDLYEGVRGISPAAAWILSGTEEEEAKRQRNENYKILRERLSGKQRFRPILHEWEEKKQREGGGKAVSASAPLYFAIYAEERNNLQKFLGAHDIYAPVLWPKGRENENCLTTDEKYIYDHMLALPLDQRYGESEMLRIAEVMDAYEAQTPVVGIRTDANDTVAMGHVMRCLTIARKLKQKGSRVIFFTADEYAGDLLNQAGMEQICLHTKWNRMEEELIRLREELLRTGCKKLLVDSYEASPGYFEKLRDLCRLIYIDDCFENVYPVDMLINYNGFHVRFPYEKVYKEKTKLLLGTAYVPLREEFQKTEDGNKDSLSEAKVHVLLSAGGGDLCNALEGILAEAVKEEELRQVVFHGVVGRFHPNREALEALAEKHPGILLHREVKNMAALMKQCHAAISAAGTMLFELSAMRVPTVFFVSADNQQYDSEYFAAEERMLFAGDIRKDRGTCIKEICRCLKRLLKDRHLQEHMKRELSRITDGRGAERIAEEVLGL